MNTEQATSFEALCDMGRALLDEQDRQRWSLGEIVDTVQTHYGDHSFIVFCEQTKARPKTLYQYRQVYRFYPRDVWKEYPLVRYTQWRDAMRLKDATKALELIARANDANMRMVEFYDELERVAGKQNSTASKVFDAVVQVIVHTNSDYVTFECDAVLTPGALYRVVITEAV